MSDLEVSTKLDLATIRAKNLLNFLFHFIKLPRYYMFYNFTRSEASQKGAYNPPKENESPYRSKISTKNFILNPPIGIHSTSNNNIAFLYVFSSESGGLNF